MKIIVFIQYDGDKINPVSLEALQAAQKLASQSEGIVSAITFKSKIGNQLNCYNINEVLVIESPQLKNYNPLQYINAIQNIVSSNSPDLLIFGHTYETRDWVPRLSARLDIPFISDCIDFKFDTDLTLVRSVYQGKFNADLSINTDKCIVSFQAGAFKSDELKQGNTSIRNIDMELIDSDSSIQLGDKFQESTSSVDLSQAEIIVSVGRGIGKEENLQIARELATALKAELASSRPVVDSGWLEAYHQVGSSGQTVSPKLYFALGISGAIQHMVGMKGSKNIMVINKDPNAPIFEIADYGIVGDIFEIIPKLIDKIQSS